MCLLLGICCTALGFQARLRCKTQKIVNSRNLEPPTGDLNATQARWKQKCTDERAHIFMALPRSLDTVFSNQWTSMTSPARTDVERRRRPRLPIHLTVYLSRRTASRQLESTTENMSSHGFYCFVSDSVPPGEVVQIAIIVPNYSDQSQSLCIQGSAEVVRVEDVGGRYGIGCRIQDYSIVPISQSLLLGNVVVG